MLYRAQLYKLKTCREAARHQSLNAAVLRLRLFPPPPSTSHRSARPQIRYLCSRRVFSSARHMFTSHIHLSSTKRWLEFGTDSEAALSLLPPSTHNTPSHIATHSTLLLSKGYPSAPEPNSSHVFWERNARL